MMNERKQKIYYYSNGGKVWGLSGYMFFWLPFLVLGALSTLFDYFTAWDDDPVGYVISLGVLLMGILSIITIHWIDNWAFWSNIVFLSLYTVRIILDVVSVSVTAFQLNQAINETFNQTSESLGNLPYFNVVSGFVQSSFSAGVGIGTFLVIMGSFIILLLFAIFFYVFIKNRKLFFTSLRDLKKEYD